MSLVETKIQRAGKSFLGSSSSALIADFYNIWHNPVDISDNSLSVNTKSHPYRRKSINLHLIKVNN